MKQTRNIEVTTVDESPSFAGDDAVAQLCNAATAVLKGFDPNGGPVITLGEDPAKEVQARTCVPLHHSDVGAEVVVVFGSADPASAIILGVIRASHAAVGEVALDGETISLSAEHSITLRCGEASLTLTRDGKVVIRGAHVVSHAAGVNRVRGGSVQLN